MNYKIIAFFLKKIIKKSNFLKLSSNIGNLIFELRRVKPETNQVLSPDRFREVSHAICDILIKDFKSRTTQVSLNIQGIVIWRAGLAFVQPLINNGYSNIGFFHSSTDKTTNEVTEYYHNYHFQDLSKISSQKVLLCDPIINSGSTISHAIDKLLIEGIKEENIHILCILSLTETVDALLKKYPSLGGITVANFEEGRLPNGFLNPGVGDFGDRYCEEIPESQIDNLLRLNVFSVVDHSILSEAIFKEKTPVTIVQKVSGLITQARNEIITKREEYIFRASQFASNSEVLDAKKSELEMIGLKNAAQIIMQLNTIPYFFHRMNLLIWGIAKRNGESHILDVFHKNAGYEKEARYKSLRLSFKCNESVSLNLIPLRVVQKPLGSTPYEMDEDGNIYYFGVKLEYDNPKVVSYDNQNSKFGQEYGYVFSYNTPNNKNNPEIAFQQLRLNPFNKEICPGSCKFCARVKPLATETEQKTRGIFFTAKQITDSIFNNHGNIFHYVKEVKLITDLFGSEEQCLDFIVSLKNEFELKGFKGEYLFLVGQDIRTEEGLRIYRTFSERYDFTLEAFERRRFLMNAYKGMPLEEVEKILFKARKLGFNPIVLNYIMGLDSLESFRKHVKYFAGKGLIDMFSYKIFGSFATYQDNLKDIDANDFEYYLEMLRIARHYGIQPNNNHFAFERGPVLAFPHLPVQLSSANIDIESITDGQIKKIVSGKSHLVSTGQSEIVSISSFTNNYIAPKSTIQEVYRLLCVYTKKTYDDSLSENDMIFLINNMLQPKTNNLINENSLSKIVSRDYIPGAYRTKDIRGSREYIYNIIYRNKNILERNLDLLIESGILDEELKQELLLKCINLMELVCFMKTNDDSLYEDDKTIFEMNLMAQQVSKIVLFGDSDVKGYYPFETNNKITNSLALLLNNEPLNFRQSMLRSLRAFMLLKFLPNNIRVGDINNYARIIFRQNQLSDNISLAVDDFEIYEKKVINSQKPTVLSVLLDDNGESVFVLRMIMDQMKFNPFLQCKMIARNGQHRNDLSFDDLNRLLRDPFFEDLIVFKKEGRLKIIENGPYKDCFDLSDLSQEAAEAILEADYILSIGQANFDTLNGIQKDIFVMFSVSQPQTSSITGLKVGSNIFAFIPKGEKYYDKYQTNFEPSEKTLVERISRNN